MSIKYNLFFSLIIILISACNSPDHKKIVSEDDTIVYQMNEDKLSAVEVNNLISGIQKAALNMVDSLFRADSIVIEERLSTTVFELEVSLNRLNEVEDLPKSKLFIAKVSDLLSFYKFEIETNFKSLIPLIYKESTSEAENNILIEYDQSFVKEEAKLFESILVAQEEFAVTNKIILSD